MTFFFFFKKVEFTDYPLRTVSLLTAAMPNAFSALALHEAQEDLQFIGDYMKRSFLTIR